MLAHGTIAILFDIVSFGRDMKFNLQERAGDSQLFSRRAP